MKEKTALYSIISAFIVSAILVISSTSNVNVESANAEPASTLMVVSGSAGLLPE